MNPAHLTNAPAGIAEQSNSTLCSGRRTLLRLATLVGNTPLIEICFTYKGEPRRLFAKCEQTNLTGSIKDRMALSILESGLRDGALRPGQTIVEVTSGNTGIAFAALGAALGHKVVIYMPEWMSRERFDIIQSYGAEVVPVSRSQGGFLGALDLVRQLAATRSDIFLPEQFGNRANVEAHRCGTGPEILAQLARIGLVPDAFTCGVGTGGTIVGVGESLCAQYPAAKIYPVEPAESPILTAGRKVGNHRIQGISDEFVPPIVDLTRLAPPIAVSDGDSILMAQKLASTLGLAVGISSGCNFLAALKVIEMHGPETVVATVFCDDNKKYLSTGLLREEPILPGYLSPDIVLTNFQVHPPALVA
jgi:cysteine synthase A